MKNTTYCKVFANILQETEKAFKLTVQYWEGWDNKTHDITFWCPKSWCRLSGGKVVEIAEFVIRRYEKEHPRAHINYLFNPCDIKRK